MERREKIRKGKERKGKERKGKERENRENNDEHLCNNLNMEGNNKVEKNSDIMKKIRCRCEDVLCIGRKLFKKEEIKIFYA